MPGTALILNAGSSSIKLALFQMPNDGPPRLLAKGGVDHNDPVPRMLIRDHAARTVFDQRLSPADGGDEALLAMLLAWADGFSESGSLTVVGHRIVHGGPNHVAPARLTADLIRSLESLTPLAPLHQPISLAPVRIIATLRPSLPQVACFDTAFHHGLSPPVSMFAIPRRFTDKGLRRYGFHGLSYEFIAARLRQIDPDLARGRAVVAHLGSGASLCALQNGRSVDTTMSLTALDGLVMATRCGSLDPGLLLYLLKYEGLSVDELEVMLYQKSGLKGVSGASSDTRALLQSADPRAAEAIELFVFRTCAAVAAMAQTLQGLDGIVFTGGIGEHSAEIRGRVCARLRWLGLELDDVANRDNQARISAANSAITAYVIATDEEATIAAHCMAVVD